MKSRTKRRVSSESPKKKGRKNLADEESTTPSKKGDLRSLVDFPVSQKPRRSSSATKHSTVTVDKPAETLTSESHSKKSEKSTDKTPANKTDSVEKNPLSKSKPQSSKDSERSSTSKSSPEIKLEKQKRTFSPKVNKIFVKIFLLPMSFFSLRSNTVRVINQVNQVLVPVHRINLSMRT